MSGSKSRSATNSAELYLDLMRRVLCGLIWEDPPVPVPWLPHSGYDAATRHAGVDWPSRAHTMIGPARLASLGDLIARALDDGVPGDLLDAGTWRGGCAVYMRAVLTARSETDRTVWVADSFQGLPPHGEWDPLDGPDWPARDALAVTQAEVERNFAAYGLLDDRVRFLPGWFDDTLPAAPVDKLAVLRADADLYASQRTILEMMEPRVSPGGYVIVDDCQLPGCRQAVGEYRAQAGITAPIAQAAGNDYTVWWQKE